MLALILFEVVEEDVDESAAAAVEDIDLLMTLEEAAVAAIAAEACKQLVFSSACSELIGTKEKPNGDPSSAKYCNCLE
jgi:hypothetical protein